jgi:glycosyltransferase involved in cell wall biosynthesis
MIVNHPLVEIAAKDHDCESQMTAQPAHALASQVALPDPTGAPVVDARGLRVLIVLKTFDPGGAEKVALRLAASLAASGAEVRLAVGRDKGVLRHQLRALPYFAVADAHPLRVPSLVLMRRLPKLVRDLAPHVVICPGNAYSLIGVMLRLRLGRRGPKLALKISNDLVRRDLPQPVRAFYHLWLRLQAPFFDSIITIAPPATEEAQALMRPDPARLTMIHNPALLDADASRLAALREATPRDRPGRHFLGIGRLVRQKNFALLIDSFADIAEPDDRLIILGEGPERRRLEALAQQRGVAAQVSMPGHCADIAPHLAATDAFVLSSDYEGLAAVLVEALAAGVPVVATDCSANMAWLLDGVGWRVAAGDQDALGQAMVTAASAQGFDAGVMRARAAVFGVDASARHWLAHLVALANTAEQASGTASRLPPPRPENAILAP